MRKLLQGFASLGAGLCMLVGIGVGKGIGHATASAVEGIGRQPEVTEKIREVLMMGHGHALIPFIIAFIVALALICIGIKCRPNDPCINEGNYFNRAMAAIGAGIAVLGGIGASIGIGEGTAFAVEGIARQPEVVERIREALLCGNIFALIPVIGVFIIALLLLFIAKKDRCFITKKVHMKK